MAPSMDQRELNHRLYTAWGRGRRPALVSLYQLDIELGSAGYSPVGRTTASVSQNV